MRWRIREIIFGLAVLAGISLYGASAYAAPKSPGDRLVVDFEGDHSADVVIGRLSRSGLSYNIHIYMGGQRIRLSLKAGIFPQPGLHLAAVDVDHDNQPDLVLTGISVFPPVAVWVNHGKGKFVQESRWLALLAKDRAGPNFRRALLQPDSQSVTSGGDPLPVLRATQHPLQEPRDERASVFDRTAVPFRHSELQISPRAPPAGPASSF